MEQLKVELDSEDKPWFNFLCESIGNDLFNDKLSPDDNGIFNIEFKINGVDVPFLKTIEEVYKLFETSIDKSASEKALELLKVKEIETEVELFKTRIENLLKLPHDY